MKRKQLLALLPLVLAGGMSATQSMGAGQMVGRNDAKSVFSTLNATLSKLYPIERWTISTTPDRLHPFAPRFCWEFFRPTPEDLGRLGEAIQKYTGNVSWLFGPPSGSAICLVAAKRDARGFVGYPPSGKSETRFVGGNAGQIVVTEEFIDEAIADVPSLCSYLERHLGLESLPPKSFDPQLTAPHDPPSPESDPVDFVERGTHTAWIVYEDRAGLVAINEVGPRQRKMLHFSVTQSEWRSIGAEISVRASIVGSANSSDTAPFPLLASIQESESSYFRETEIEALKRECLQVRVGSTNLAIRGLDKLILLCNWASRMRGDLLLRAP